MPEDQLQSLDTLGLQHRGLSVASTTWPVCSACLCLQLHLVESFHDTGFIHRELKPDNIVVGSGSEADKLFLIDLELAAKYWNSQTHEHMPYSANISFVGNPIFASNNKVLGKKVSRRDDLYSIGLMLVYFLRGSLPWTHISVRRGSLIDNIKKVKLQYSVEELTSGLPHPVMSLLGHALAVPFEGRPDYAGMRQLFQQWSAQLGKDSSSATQDLTASCVA